MKPSGWPKFIIHIKSGELRNSIKAQKHKIILEGIYVGLSPKYAGKEMVWSWIIKSQRASK
jgi:hypothetical protein